MLSNITINEAKTMFLKSMGLPRGANTLQTYRKALDTFTNVLASQQINSYNFPVADLTEESVAHFVDYMKDFSGATESLYLQVIKTFFQFLSAENLTEINLSRVRMLIHQRNRRAQSEAPPYPEADIEYFIDVISNPRTFSKLADDTNDVQNFELRNMRDRAIIIVLADTGLRAEEIRKLRC
jgi:integrase/recombinase XerC